MALGWLQRGRDTHGISLQLIPSKSCGNACPVDGEKAYSLVRSRLDVVAGSPAMISMPSPSGTFPIRRGFTLAELVLALTLSALLLGWYVRELDEADMLSAMLQMKQPVRATPVAAIGEIRTRLGADAPAAVQDAGAALEIDDPMPQTPEPLFEDFTAHGAP
jgi:prepilin-type N-terminal cleavage/methylation domain-containing protein